MDVSLSENQMFARFFSFSQSTAISKPPYGETIEDLSQFIKIKLPHNVDQPSKILALDVDESLLAFKKSIQSKSTCFINKHEIKHILHQAKKKNIMLVLVTARYFVKEEPCHVSLASVLAQLGINHFSYVFFTNGKEKEPVLSHLHAQYFKNHNKDKICLVDDRIGYLAPCADVGFDTILVDAEKEYLRAMKDFLRNKRALNVPVYDYVKPSPEDYVTRVLGL
ncbi:MAG: hypothetical protein P4M12_00605 [Gammaproteobacteria bacterium]|nr:hypothetical protein [Gammaproteobacteria bacterium]